MEVTSQLMQKFDFFLDENNISLKKKKNILSKFTNSAYGVDAINQSDSWASTSEGYYFWYFLTLKWLIFLLKNRKTYNISHKFLINCLERYLDFTSSYYIIDKDNLNYGSNYVIAVRARIRNLVDKHKKYINEKKL